jgi:hypothetical protein
MKKDPDRVQVVISLARAPGEAWHVEIASRENHDGMRNHLRTWMSATRLVYWVGEILPARLPVILGDLLTEMWGADLAQLPLDVADVASVVQEERQRIW